MPRVPIYRTNETFRAQSAPDLRVAPNQLGQKVAIAAQEVGGAVIRQMRENDETNLLAFNNAMLQNKAKLLNDPDSGFLSSQGINAQNAREQVRQQWQDQAQLAIAAMPDRIKARAEAMAGKYTLDFDDDVDRHVRQQTGLYQDQVYKDTIASTANEAALSYSNPERVAQQAESAAIATRLDRRRQGLPEDDAASAAASSVYQAALERQAGLDPLGAERRYYELLSEGKLTGASAMAIDQLIRPVAQDAASTSDADAINNGGTLSVGAAPAGIDDAIIGLESGGAATAKNPNSSATGAGQFLDSTWLDQIRKNRPELTQGKTDAEILAMRSDLKLSREMVGAYREENTRRLRAAGLSASAVNLYAAHHFGAAGATAFARASADAPMTTILDARSIEANPYLKGKTKADVLTNWQGRGLAVGQDSVTFAGPAHSEAEALQRAQQIADPRRRDAAMSKVRMQWSIRDAQEAAAKKATSERVFNTIAANTNPTASLAAIISPADYAELTRNGQLPAMENYRKNILEGRLIQDNPVLADELYRQSALDPDAFRKRDLHALADNLSASTLTELVNRQKALDSKDASQSKDWMSDEDRLNAGFTMLGIGKEGDVSGTGSESKNAPRDRLRGEFRIAYQNAYTTFMQQAGNKKPTPEQADALLRTVAKQFAPRMTSGALGVTQDDGRFKLTPKSTGGMYSRAAGYQLQISEADRTAVRDAYRAKFGINPTDAWITQYITAKRGAAK